jgi:hypothetical protein
MAEMACTIFLFFEKMKIVLLLVQVKSRAYACLACTKRLF